MKKETPDLKNLHIPGSTSSLRFRTLDMHTGGEPLRIVLDGPPELKGNNILEKRRYCHSDLDHIRKILMWEPRGHADMYGCYITAPNDPGAAFGVIFMHNEGYSTMCGHATIALGRWAVDTGIVPKETPETHFWIDVPCGRIGIRVNLEDDNVTAVAFENVPSFVLLPDQEVHVPGIGHIRYDIAYGGAFYAIVNAHELDLDLSIGNAARLKRVGMEIKNGIIGQNIPVRHPVEEDLGFLYGTIITAPSGTPGVDSRNVCIFADGELDRSPTGSGVSARLALRYHKGQLTKGEKFTVESITGSIFEGSVREETMLGGKPAVIPAVSGMAWYTGEQMFVIEENDPLKDGFLIR